MEYAFASMGPTQEWVALRIIFIGLLAVLGVAYTQHVQVAGIPIMFLTRTKSWMKYVF